MEQRRFSRRLVAKQKNTMHLDDQLELDGVRKDTKMLEDLGTKQLRVASKQVCKGIQDIGKQGFKDTLQLEDMEQGSKDSLQFEDRGQQEIEFCEQLGAGGCVDKDTKVNVMKLDENKNVLHPSVAAENDLPVPAAILKECIMVHKPGKCEETAYNSKVSFLKGLFSTDSTSIPMKGISIESSNSVEWDCCKSMDNSYNTSIESDLVIKRFKSEDDLKAKRFKSEDLKVVSPEKLEVTGKSNQEVVEIEVDAANDINSESKCDLEIGSFIGGGDWRQNIRSVENTNQTHTFVGKNLGTFAYVEECGDAVTIVEQAYDALTDGEQGDNVLANEEHAYNALANEEQTYDALANEEQADDTLANGEKDEDFFENRFSEGFHNAMGMAVVDMQNEKKPSTVSHQNVSRNSQIFGVSELIWRLGTICCDSVHTDVANHVASHRHEATKFKCNGCKIKVLDSRRFLDHINSYHSVASPSLKCLENKCRLLFPTAFSLKIHQQEYHMEEAARMRMKCNTCSKKEDGTRERGDPSGEVFVTHIGEHALKVHRELWI